MSETFLVKACTKEKNRFDVAMPARQVYSHEDIPLFLAEAERLRQSAFFISGKYGFISIEEPIEYYGAKLTEEMIPVMTEMVVGQINAYIAELGGIPRQIIYYQPSDTANPLIPRPYEIVLANACTTLGIKFTTKNCSDL